jgi:AcrR family transcriptional regulator
VDQADETSRLRPAKRAAIIAGALEVFAREGFSRSSIDAIATASGVSTRTIYKHFTDKAALFAAVLADSAAQVAAEETALIEHHLGDVARPAQVEPALISFATAWLSGGAESRKHQALIQQAHTEAAHLGASTVAAWWQEGPGRVRAELAAHLARWSRDGLLRIPDAERAAAHFSQLVSATPGPPSIPPSPRERKVWIAAGVRAFVRGHHS